MDPVRTQAAQRKLGEMHPHWTLHRGRILFAVVAAGVLLAVGWVVQAAADAFGWWLLVPAGLVVVWLVYLGVRALSGPRLRVPRR